jgi:hypothetical protein
LEQPLPSREACEFAHKAFKLVWWSEAIKGKIRDVLLGDG